MPRKKVPKDTEAMVQEALRLLNARIPLEN
jgi:hypothetical protein